MLTLEMVTTLKLYRLPKESLKVAKSADGNFHQWQQL